ncbi:hypothetical protein D3C85_1935500 [compost metagenome]
MMSASTRLMSRYQATDGRNTTSRPSSNSTACSTRTGTDLRSWPVKRSMPLSNSTLYR